MNNDLMNIIESLVNLRILSGDVPVTTDAFCAEFNYLNEVCSGVECNECIFGHKSTQYYPKEIIKVWSTKWIKT